MKKIKHKLIKSEKILNFTNKYYKTYKFRRRGEQKNN